MVKRPGQFTRHGRNEVRLHLIGGPQRFVAFAKRPFDPDRVGHIDIGHHHRPVRQRYNGKIDDAVIGTFDTAAHGFVVGDTRDHPAFEFVPVFALVPVITGFFDHFADMRRT